MTLAQRRAQSEIRQQQTQASKVNQAGRIILTGMAEIKAEIKLDIAAAGMTVYSDDEYVNRNKPMQPTTHLMVSGEYKIEDFEIAKAKMAEYGQELILDVSGYNQDCSPRTASFFIHIMTMRH